MAELTEQIEALQIELQAHEDWHSRPDWEVRDKALRQEIRELEHQRDLLPPQRDG
jgi:hypothetical protein